MTLADRIHRAVRGELADAIRNDRNDVDPEDLAAALLDWEGGNRSLVGLTRGCRRAVYFDETVSLLHSFPIPEGELRSRGEVESRTAAGRPETYAAVRVRDRDDWDWLHPRYQWVFDVELPPPAEEEG